MNTRKDWKTMKKSASLILLAALILVAGASADTLRLRSGRRVEGTLVSADPNQVSFAGADGQPKTYAVSDVEAITFAGPPPPAAAAPPKPTSVTVPAGTTLLVRMVDSLDTSKTQTGQLFTATLETSLVANDVIVARKGTTVHGRVTKSSNAGRMAGKSELQLELANIVINGAAQPIATSGFQQKGSSSGASTAKKTAGAAGLGAAIGAISGNAGKGAAIGAVSGAGLSAATKGQSIRVPSETLLEFTISVPTTMPVSK
jgi:hypothetical protein